MIIVSKTIKQLADELGVSKQAISYRLKQLEKEFERQTLVVKENGVFVTTKMAEKLIVSAFSENKDRQKENEFLSLQKTALNELKKQLKEKENYIQQQQERINFLENQMSDLLKNLDESHNQIHLLVNSLKAEQNNYYQLQDKFEKLVTVLQEKNEKKGFDFWKK